MRFFGGATVEVGAVRWTVDCRLPKRLIKVCEVLF